MLGAWFSVYVWWAHNLPFIGAIEGTDLWLSPAVALDRAATRVPHHQHHLRAGDLARELHAAQRQYVKRNPEARRERLPEPAELTAFKAVCSPFLAVYIDIKYMTGIRKGDMLKLRLDQHFTPDGIDLRISKNGKHMIYEWTPDLEDAVKRAKSIKRRVGSFYLFATRTGQPYSESGFDSIWQRYMRRALKDGVLKERFREHDIRASTASADEEHAQERLGQKNKSSTDAYIRSKKVTMVKPLPKNI